MTPVEQGIADVLLRGEKLTPEQLEHAKKFKLQNGYALGEALLHLGYCKEDVLADALSKLTQVAFASVKNNLLDPEPEQGLEKLVDVQLARDNLVLPLYLEEDILTVAMTDPSNELVKEALRLKTGMTIKPMVATKSELLMAIYKLYEETSGPGQGGGSLPRPT